MYPLFLRFLLTLFFLPLCANAFHAQPLIQWEKSLGGTGTDAANCIIHTSDGGYAVAGYTNSNDDDVTGLHNTPGKEFDFWITKLNSNGTIEWQKTLGGSFNDAAICIIQTSDGGFVATGETTSDDGDVTGKSPGHSLWVVKLNSVGVLQWQKTYGGTCRETGTSIIQTTDGGYALTGYACSKDGDVTEIHLGPVVGDYWVVKLSKVGVIEWEKTYGGEQGDEAFSIIQTSDGGYAVAGWTASNGGDVTGNHSLGALDIWIVKLSNSGSIQWKKTYGGTGYDYGYSIIQTKDGGYAIAGSTNSTDGDVSGSHAGGFDMWVVKTDSKGVIEWQKALGGSGDDQAHSIIQTSDGGYAVAGYTSSTDGDVTGLQGGHDMWVVKLSVAGAIVWQKTLGSSGDDKAFSIVETLAGEYTVAGFASVNDGDVTGNHGGPDFWVVKLYPATLVSGTPVQGVINLYREVVAIDTCYNAITLSSTGGFNVGDRALLIQMKGATIDESNTNTFGTIQNLGNAGNYELATITGITPTTLTIKNQLLHQYSPLVGRVQIIRVPSYQSVTVTDTVKPLPWNGIVGGVVVLEASDTIFLNAPITADGMGFRGGNVSSAGSKSGLTDYVVDGSIGDGGFKGESIVEVDPSVSAGRGPLAGGGGGGNARNAGGGGGGNFGAGGVGGNQLTAFSFSAQPIGGLGGGGIFYGALGQKVWMGSGGGGGQQLNNNGTAGGNGGGIIILIARTINATGSKISANGLGAFTTNGGGAGGGGAGGVIIANLTDLAGTVMAEANGGDGGNNDEASLGATCYAPGGGGSGGVIYSSGNLTVTPGNLAGGNAGSVLNSSASCNNTSYGAASGDPGFSFSAKLVIEGFSSVQYPSVLTHADSICIGDQVTLSASGAVSYLWSPAMGLSDVTISNPVATPSTTTTYTVLMTNSSGCAFTDSVTVTVRQKLQPQITGTQVLCEGDSAILGTTGNYQSYLWSTGATTPTITVGTSGTYTITVQASGGCSGTSAGYTVTVNPRPKPSITASTLLLLNSGDQSILSVAPGFSSYVWSTGETTNQIKVSTIGTYIVTVTDVNGCTGKDSVDIESPASLPKVDLGLPVIQAFPGDHVLIPINIISSQNLGNSGATDFTYSIRFNRSLLTPVDPNVQSFSSGRERTVTLTGTRANTLSSGALIQTEFIAALGDTTETTLYFDSLSWTNGKPVVTKLANGLFQLLGVCPQGGNRLFSQDGRILLSSAKPNPTHGMTTLDYQLLEEGTTQLMLIDMLGRNSLTIVHDYQKPGVYHVVFDASQLMNGIYNCVLQTPSQIRMSKMEVYH